MINDVAIGLVAARSGARIYAALVVAGQIAGAVGVYDALGPAVGRLANVAGEARAGRRVVNHATDGVRSARGRYARILGRRGERGR